MRLHRFFVDADLTSSPLDITDAELIHQWTKVLRLESGDALILCNGKGREARGKITTMEKGTIVVTLDAPNDVTAEPLQSVSLYCSILKRENFEWVVQKSVEVGVKAIIPLITERTVKTGLKMDRLLMIAKEASEQSGRGIIPTIFEPMKFDSALTKAKNRINLFYDCPHPSSTKPSTTQTKQKSHEPIGIWIGPEGGWTEGEAKKAEENGHCLSSLGSLILRAETAAVIASYMAVQNP